MTAGLKPASDLPQKGKRLQSFKLKLRVRSSHLFASTPEIGNEIAFGSPIETLSKFAPRFPFMRNGDLKIPFIKYSTTEKEIRSLKEIQQWNPFQGLKQRGREKCLCLS
jgi:hypothetical protein